MHTPVLLKEAIDGLDVWRGGKYIDATFGEGGYSNEILKRNGKVLGIDLDVTQISNVKSQMSNLKLVQGNFRDIEKIAKENDFFPIDGIVFDLGLSMRQIEESGRGFSYKAFNEPLDMRLDFKNEITASELLNSLSEKDLFEIFARYGEDINSSKIAKNIFDTRGVSRLETVKDLIKIIDKTLGKKDVRTYSRIFQALRIEVNDEFNNLRKGLVGSLKILKKKGRLVVISFHSLEDRIVKKFIKENRLEMINKKPISGKRSFERSAKLRIISL